MPVVTVDADPGVSMTIGVVVIGRNEGERLRTCLQSVMAGAARTVYVDSGSTDGSVSMARAMGAEVVALNMDAPFTAARARNAGFRRMQELSVDLTYVQFVDGDCEMVLGWLGAAATFLDVHPAAAVVAGRLRERHPERSIYNMLCDLEWNVPPGPARACGGNAMMRIAAFTQAGGFLPDLIAGEEPELCVRLRMAGWEIWRIPAEMALHDAAMTHFAQWWKRTLRGGYAYAQGAYLHGAPPERHGVRESRRAWLWAAVIPATIAAATAGVGVHGLLLLLVYPLQVARLAAQGRRSARENWWQAVFLVLGKFPEAMGQFWFLLHRCRGSQARLIEYK